MKNIILVLFFLTTSILLFNGFAKHANAQTAVWDALTVRFSENNSNTSFEVIYRFEWKNTVGSWQWRTASRNAYTWTNSTVGDAPRRPDNWANWFVHWSTSCKDPAARLVPGTCYWSGDEQACLFDTLNQDVSYRVGSTPGDNLGNVSYNGSTGTLFTGATCPQCRPGATRNAYCGSGSNRCDRIRQVCNSNGQWVTQVVARDVSTCIGVDGCCLSNSNCSGGSYFCGSGGNRCDRRQNYCSSNQRCGVRTTNTNAPACVGQNGCCVDNSDCGSNQYCKNGPYGTCTTYAKIAGRVFVDRNTNNRWDSNSDIGLSGMRVQRRPQNVTSGWAEETNTNPNGYYAFTQKNNPSYHDVRTPPAQYDTTCEYQSTVRPNGFIWQNILATPTLGNVNFMFRFRTYNINGQVWRDANFSGALETGSDVRVNNTNVRVKTIWNASRANTGNSDNINSNGYFSIPGHRHDKTYAARLLTGSLPNGWSVIGSGVGASNLTAGNTINGLTINCANYGGLRFLVTNDPTRYTYETDLVVDSVTIPDGLVNTSATGTVIISNDGNQGTGVGFNIAINRGDGVTTTISTGGLGAGVTRSLNFNITRPPTANTYTAIATVDSGNVIAESEEGNNRGNGQYDVTNTASGDDPDLVIDSFSIPSSDINTTSNGSLVVRNASLEPTPSGFSISIDNGTGNIISVGAPALAAGASTTVGFTINIPGNVDTYTAVATVDSTNIIAESDEANNQATTTYNATYTPPTYSIQGGVFIDSVDAQLDSDGIKSASEPYINGTINVSSDPNSPYNSSGFTATDLLTGIYAVTFDAINDLPRGWELTYPQGVIPPNPSFQITVGDPTIPGGCSTGAHSLASCDVDGNVIGVNFGIRQIPADPWFNGIGGDMRSDNPLINRIPDASGAYFSERNSNFPSGGVVFGQFELSPLTGEPARISNNRNWDVGISFTGKNINTAYSFMQSILEKNGVWNGRNIISTTTLPTGLVSGIYSSGNINITGGNYTFPTNSDIVLMVNGNLTIDNNIFIPVGSTVIFIVNGDIRINPDVTHIEGIFSANQKFIIRSVSAGSADERLYIEGSVIANAEKGSTTPFENQRNLFLGNETLPVVQIIYRPDFVLNAPSYIKSSNYIIKEVAPGSEN